MNNAYPSAQQFCDRPVLSPRRGSLTCSDVSSSPHAAKFQLAALDLGPVSRCSTPSSAPSSKEIGWIDSIRRSLGRYSGRERCTTGTVIAISISSSNGFHLVGREPIEVSQLEHQETDCARVQNAYSSVWDVRLESLTASARHIRASTQLRFFLLKLY